ncbi:MAG: TIGR02147 family protein [Fibrobacteres bacterium]|nr:TIGR02147 family protein [Fibrobacterota bacterium]
MDVEQKTIYDYNDFRAFLGDWYASEKLRRGKFTKAEVSRLLGLPNSRNYFSDLLGGKELSETFLERMVALLALGAAEARYFRALVRFQQAQTPEDRDELLERLVALNRSPRTFLDGARLEYFRHWWHGAVRALLDTGDFADEPERIAKTLIPSITPKQAKDSLALLDSLGLTAKNDQGFWKPTDRAVSSPEGLREDLLLQLQIQQLDLVRQSLLRRKAPRRLVATNVVSVSQDGFRHLLERMEKTRSEVRSIVHKDSLPAERVCQVVIALVPLTEEKVSR